MTEGIARQKVLHIKGHNSVKQEAQRACIAHPDISMIMANQLQNLIMTFDRVTLISDSWLWFNSDQFSIMMS